MATLDAVRTAVNRERGLDPRHGFGPAPAVNRGNVRGIRAGGQVRGPVVPFDPALAAFLRQMGAEEAAIRAQARSEAETAQRRFDLTAGTYDERIADEAGLIGNDAESRGVYRSGSTVNRLARSRGTIEAERATAAGTLRDQLMATQAAARDRVLGLRREAAEQELAGRTRIGERRARSAYGGKG